MLPFPNTRGRVGGYAVSNPNVYQIREASYTLTMVVLVIDTITNLSSWRHFEGAEIVRTTTEAKMHDLGHQHKAWQLLHQGQGKRPLQLPPSNYSTIYLPPPSLPPSLRFVLGLPSATI